VAEPRELTWVLRPDPAGPYSSWLAVHAGKQIRFVKPAADTDGHVDVVLADGVQIRVHRHEVTLR
jgi:hypothetical protein